MGFDLAQGAPATGGKVSGPAIRAGLLGKKKLVFTLTLNAAAQAEYFGAAVEPGERFNVFFGEGPDDGRIKILMVPAGKCIATRGPRGSIRIRVAPWGKLPKAPQALDQCTVVSAKDGAVIAELPGWY